MAHDVPQFPGAPNYREAYAEAPPLLDEELELLATPDAGAQAAAGPQQPHSRVLLLRRAAYWDRRAHELQLAGFLGMCLDEDVMQPTTKRPRRRSSC
jgi:hypothetical protein